MDELMIFRLSQKLSTKIKVGKLAEKLWGEIVGIVCRLLKTMRTQ